MMGMATGVNLYYTGSVIYTVGTTADTSMTGYSVKVYRMRSPLVRAIDECYRTYLKVEPARKNYRWFHAFSPMRVPRSLGVEGETLSTRLRRFVKAAASDGRRLKRKRYLQELRRA